MTNYPLNSILMISILIYTLIQICLADDCLTHSFPDLNYPKSLTLYNGYQLLVTSKGIYSFEPDLSNIAFHYNFTKEQKFSTNIAQFKNSINQVELVQFNEENGGKNYAICLANNIIYFINENGKIIFFQELENKVEVDYSITLVAYKYYSGEYYFVVGYNDIDVNFGNIEVLSFFYYKITNQNKIQFITKRTMQLGSEDLNLQCIACHAMFSSSNTKSLVCFINAISGSYYYFNAYAFNPDQNFQYLFMAHNALFENVFSPAKVMKSCINDEQTKVFICYSLDNEINVKCFYYNSKENKLSEIFINFDFCNINIYGFNIFFFKQSNEYILSCIDNSKKQFSMKRIDINFNLIEDDDNNFYEKSFSDCNDYDFFSIIYISKYNVYSGIFNSDCLSGKYIRIYMLSNSICIEPNKKEENAISTALETTIIKTTLPIYKTTIPHIITTVPEITTTNIPIHTQQITTNSFKDEGLMIDSTIQKAMTTVLDIDKKTEAIPIQQTNSIYPENEKTDIIDITDIIQKTAYPVESICEENKKYSEGKCICDIEKGYYSLNYKSSENKCYKKNEIPKNVYFNNITKSYELCYKSCEPCCLSIYMIIFFLVHHLS